jgi:hypothetical protein
LLLKLGAILVALTPAFAAGPLPTRTVYDATLTNGFSIHHVRHEVMGPQTRLYIDDHSFVDVATSDIADLTELVETVAPAPELLKKDLDLKQVVSAASDKHQIDPDLISSVIHAESRFNPKAVSPKGARGLMQLMPATAARLGVADAFDANANVDAGTRYLRELLLQYNGDIAKALAAYNAGPLRVQQYRGVPPYRETRAYVAQVIRDFNRKKTAQQSSARNSKTSATEGTAGGKSR